MVTLGTHAANVTTIISDGYMVDGTTGAMAPSGIATNYITKLHEHGIQVRQQQREERKISRRKRPSVSPILSDFNLSFPFPYGDFRCWGCYR